MKAKRFKIEFSYPVNNFKIKEELQRIMNDSETLSFIMEEIDTEIEGVPVKNICAVSTENPETFLNSTIVMRESSSYSIISFVKEMASDGIELDKDEIDLFDEVIQSGKNLGVYFNFRCNNSNVTILNLNNASERNRYEDFMTKKFSNHEVYTLEKIGNLLVPVRKKNKESFIKKNFEKIFIKIISDFSRNITSYLSSDISNLDTVIKALKLSYKTETVFPDSLGLILDLNKIYGRERWRYSEEAKEKMGIIVKYATKCAKKFNTKGEVFSRYTKRKDMSGNKGQSVEHMRTFKSDECDAIMNIFHIFGIIDDEDLKYYNASEYTDITGDETSPGFRRMVSSISQMLVVHPREISYRSSVHFIKNDSLKFPLAYNLIRFLSERQNEKIFSALSDDEKKKVSDFIVKTGSRILLVKELPEILLMNDICEVFLQPLMSALYQAIDRYESREALTVISLINNDLFIGYRETNNFYGNQRVKVFQDIPEEYKRVRKIYFEAILKK